MVEYVILEVCENNTGTESSLEFKSVVEAHSPSQGIQKIHEDEVRLEEETYFAIPKSYFHQYTFNAGTDSPIKNMDADVIETLENI